MQGSSASSFFVLAVLFAAADWTAVILARKRAEYVLKPATLVAIVVGAVLLAQQAGWPRLAYWFIPALAASLAGDVFLMLAGDRWFLPGLVAFLLAHICYIVGFNLTLPSALSLWLLIPIAAVDLVVLRRIVRGAQSSGASELSVPIVVYGVILSLTLYSGWASWFRPGWSAMARLLAGLGSTLFFASDLMLAWDRFVSRSRGLHIAVIVTYHLAQLGLAIVIGLAP